MITSRLAPYRAGKNLLTTACADTILFILRKLLNSTELLLTLFYILLTQLGSITIHQPLQSGSQLSSCSSHGTQMPLSGSTVLSGPIDAHTRPNHRQHGRCDVSCHHLSHLMCCELAIVRWKLTYQTDGCRMGCEWSELKAGTHPEASFNDSVITRGLHRLKRCRFCITSSGFSRLTAPCATL